MEFFCKCKGGGFKEVASNEEGNIKIFSGTANLPLAREIANYVGIPLGKAKLNRFSDGEITIFIGESVRGNDSFIIQPLCSPVNENIMELLILMDALKRASAKSVNAVVPYYGYARQDRKSRAREPITAKLLADLLTTAGANRVIAMDLHAGQIQGFFNIPFDHLTSIALLAKYFKDKHIEDGIVVSPDLGGVTRARQLANYLEMPIAIIDKKRYAPNQTEVMNLIGDVDGKNAILMDDIIDTGGTIILAAEALLEKGARETYACCTHPVFSGSALEKLCASALTEVIVTNTIPLGAECPEKIKVISVAPLIGEAIVRIHQRRSVSELFE